MNRMEHRLLAATELEGLWLIRDKLDLSAAFLIPHLLQTALSANLKVHVSLLHLASVCTLQIQCRICYRICHFAGCFAAGARLSVTLPASSQKISKLSDL